MIQAYVLVQTDVGSAPQVAHAANGLTGVTRAHDVTGPYDVIVTVEATDIESLGREVVSGIQRISGVTRTITCSVVS